MTAEQVRQRRAEDMGSGTCIGTASGRSVDLLDPDPATIDIEDIATGLSHVARFAGQTTQHYSVAQHSVLCSSRVPREHAAQALLHDATEAYMGDCPRPLKVMLGESWRAIERRLQSAIMLRFGLPEDLAPEIKTVDNRMLATERRAFQPNGPSWAGSWLDGVEPYDFVTFGAWSPEHSKGMFLEVFETLT